LKDENESLKGQVKELRSVIETQPQEVEERLKSEMDRLLKRNQEVHEENTKLEEEMSEMEQTLVATKMQYAEVCALRPEQLCHILTISDQFPTRGSHSEMERSQKSSRLNLLANRFLTPPINGHSNCTVPNSSLFLNINKTLAIAPRFGLATHACLRNCDIPFPIRLGMDGMVRLAG
jgi:hypothetical protein